MLKVVQGRFQTANGQWIVPRFFTEFKPIWFVLTGREAELIATLDHAVAGRANGIRSAAMLDWATANPRNPSHPLIQFSPRTPGYVEARERAAQLIAERGLYWELAWSCDQQRIVPDMNERFRWLDEYIDFCLRHRHLVPQLGNEPFKNGWKSADDPEFLRFGAHLKSRLDGRAFSLGDPSDIVDNAAVSLEPLFSEWRDVLFTGGPTSYSVLHPERKMPDERFSGSADHLRGADEILNPLKSAMGWSDRAAYIADEPEGGSATRQSGRRENRPARLVAMQLVGALLGGYTYLWRSEEEPAGLVAGTPGWLEGAVAADIPGSPDFKFINATVGGSPIRSFTGFSNGKVRCLSNGREAWVTAYGNGGALSWDTGYAPTIVQEWKDGGDVVQLWNGVR